MSSIVSSPRLCSCGPPDVVAVVSNRSNQRRSGEGIKRERALIKIGGAQLLGARLVRVYVGRGNRRRARPGGRPRALQRFEKLVEFRIARERVAPRRDQEIDLIRRQLEARLDVIERPGAVRTQLLEAYLADEELHILAIPAWRRAKTAAVRFPQSATPLHQVVLPIAHGIVERRI